MAQDTAQIRKVQDKEGTQFFPITHVDAVIDENGDAVSTLLAGKQATLVSGTNIKTINSQSLLGSGNIVIEGGGGGSIDSIVMNGGAVTVTGGVADLGTVITQHQDISGKADKVSNSTNGNFAGLDASGNLTDSGHKHSDYQAALVSGTNIKTVNSTSLLGSGNVSVGTYSKPSGGIPKTDLASAVQTSLGKADTALQSYTETDPVFTASAAAGIATTDISAWDAKLSGVTFNGVSATVTGGVAAITATIPAAPGTLQTNLSTAQSTSASEALSGSVKLHKIAKTGTYSDLIGTPTIPTKVSELTNDAGYTTNTGTVTRVDVGTSQYSPASGIVSLPAYPTTLPASDVSAWAKASTKPSYTFSELTTHPTTLAGYGITDAKIANGVITLGSNTITPLTAHQAVSLASGTNNGTLKLTVGSTTTDNIAVKGLGSNAYTSTAYLPLTGGTMTGHITMGTNRILMGSGFLCAPYTSLSHILTWHDGTDYRAVFHAGNSNLSTVAWACSTLTASGNVTIAGNVGIGTTSPTEKLHVAGNIFASGTITPGSDSRIKNNQKDISQEIAFSVIENLKPKTWIWNEKSNENLNGKSAAGLVAQEVKEILPDAVTISENGDIKDFHSLNYNTIQGYEIAAIKGLIEEVKSLKAEIAELKKQIK